MLKGQDLLDFVSINKDTFTKAELVKSSGYVKDNGKLFFTDFYISLLRAKIQKTANNNPSKNKTISKAICIIKSLNAIQNESGSSAFFYTNTFSNFTITKHSKDSFRLIQVSYNDEHIVTVLNNKISIERGIKKTKFVKEFLNRFLQHFAGVKLFQKQDQWYISSPGSDDLIYFADVEMI
jgi:hypothetical protein